MTRLLYIIMLLLAVLVLPTGCIKEDFDDCDNVAIYFQYFADNPKKDKDVLFQYMKKVDLYVFDESGVNLGSFTYYEDELKSFSAKPTFRLTPGRRYKVVTVGNAYDATEVVNLNAANFDNIFLQNPNWGESGRVTNHDDNYLGQQEFTIPSNKGVMYRDTVTMYSAHIDVDIRIYGLPAPGENGQGKAAHPYELSIENSNAQCSFNNETNTDEHGTIYPELIYDPEENCYRTDNFRLFRLDDHGVIDSEHCKHTLVLKDLNAPEDKRVIAQGSLFNYITSNDAIEDLVTKQEAKLPIAIQFHGLDGIITIPDWIIVDGKPDWK